MGDARRFVYNWSLERLLVAEPRRRVGDVVEGDEMHALVVERVVRGAEGLLEGGAAIQRGIAFLVATQAPDGSWPMISRATPDGSPGSAKLLTPITCAASSWATLALSHLTPHAD